MERLFCDRFGILALVVLSLASFALSLAILCKRNIYDDEVTSAYLLTKPITDIIATSNSGDVHPPGMYVIGRAAYLLTKSIRWSTILPLMIWYGGLFLLLFRTRSLFDNLYTYLAYAAICLYHPHVLIWSNSLRWYPSWSGLALVAVSLVFLRPRVCWRKPFGLGETACLLGLLVTLFHISYLTVILTFWLIAGVCINVRNDRKKLLLILICLTIASLMVLPQVLVFLKVHLPHAEAYQGDGDEGPGGGLDPLPA